MNELKEFVELVGRMRSEQKEYFTSRSKETLYKCKALERQVDEVVKKFTGESTADTTKQQSLFKN